MRKSIIADLFIVVLVAVLNVAAWNSTAFSDWYIANIFPIWVNTYGRVTGLFPFSVGEWLLGAGVALAALAVVLGVVRAAVGAVAAARHVLRRGAARTGSEDAARHVLRRRAVRTGSEDAARHVLRRGAARTGSEDAARHVLRRGAARTAAGIRAGKSAYSRFKGFSAGFYRFFVRVLLIVSLVMTLNCFILYHASTFSEHYFGEDDGEYDLTELIMVYNMVAERCNSLALAMERDESGMPLFSGMGKDEALPYMADEARELMQKLGETYPQLDGYYPRPKALLSSDFMCQQYMQGYYFPFSMEANYNDVMHILNIPATMCHELAHLRGYIFEDEANFISYLACVQSDDPFFRYAGYLSVLVYLNNDLYKAWEESRTAYEEAVAIVPPVVVDAQVWTDNIFVTQEEWDRINGKALIETEIVDKAADAFVDTTLKINGVTDGKVSYSRVVRLLLQYYRLSADSL